MIPETVPSGRVFENVQMIRFSHSGPITDEEEKVLRSIYPNAEIVTEQ